MLSSRDLAPLTSYVVSVVALDPDQQRAVGLDHVGLVDAGLLDVGAGLAGGLLDRRGRRPRGALAARRRRAAQHQAVRRCRIVAPAAVPAPAVDPVDGVVDVPVAAASPQPRTRPGRPGPRSTGPSGAATMRAARIAGSSCQAAPTAKDRQRERGDAGAAQRADARASRCACHGVGRPAVGSVPARDRAWGRVGAMAERDFDIVLFGATGFTGGLTAEYLARQRARPAAAGRWPAATRRSSRRCATGWPAIDPRLETMDLLVADSSDAASLTAVAERTTRRDHHGRPVPRATASRWSPPAPRAGTDYVDLTGEPEFVDRMYVAHHDTAVASGARIVHACGFDSIPHDLGVYFTVQQLPTDGPVTVRGVVRRNGTVSGGTFHSALDAFSRVRQMQGRVDERATQGGRGRRAGPGGRWPASRTATPCSATGCCRCRRSTRRWCRAAARPWRRTGRSSATRTTPARRRCGTPPAASAGVGALGLAAQVPPVRDLLKKRVPAGRGAERGAAPQDVVHRRLRRRGRRRRPCTPGSPAATPATTETAKMLAESALCLAFDNNPPTAGQVTTAVAMGDNLLTRLQKAGIEFEVVD